MTERVQPNLSQWTRTTVGSLGIWRGGSTPSKARSSFWDGGNYLWVSPKDFRSSTISDSEDKLTQIGLAGSALQVFEPGDIPVVFRSGVLRHSFPVANVTKPFTVNQDVKVLSAGPEVVSRFAYHLLKSAEPIVLRSAVKSGTTVESIDFRTFSELPVLLPPLPEQRGIAEILDTVDDAIRKTEEVIAKLKQVKAGLLHDLLTRGIDEHGQLRNPIAHPEQFKNSPLGRIPREWEVNALETVAEIGSGVTVGRNLTGGKTIELPYLRVANVQDGYLDLTEIKTISVRVDEIDRYALQEGDVLMNEGGDFDKLGRGAVWRGEIEPCLHQNHVFRVRTSRSQLLPDFLAAVSGSEVGKRYFVQSSKQTTNLASINSTQLRAFPTPLPSLNEQQRIVDTTQTMDRRLQSESDYSLKLQHAKSGLMSDLLTGCVRVCEIEKAIGAVV